MPDAEPKPARDRDSIANTLTVAVLLCLVASVLVSAAAIVLKPVQERNQAEYRQRIVLEAAGLWQPGADVAAEFARIDVQMIDLETGRPVDDAGAGDYDAIEAANDPATGVDVPADLDIAGIRRRARMAPVYLVRQGGELEQVILPVYGKGLWSTMFGYLSLEPDGNTVQSIRFYRHGETPGLGDQIENPDWQAGWTGKQISSGGTGLPDIAVVRSGSAETGSRHEVDGISGATLTGRGVTNLVRYWTGPHGFGPYLERLRDKGERT